MNDELKCPHCGFTSDYGNFPDLFFFDEDNTREINEQAVIQEEMWDKGYNIVTCGECGLPFIHRTK